MPHTNKTVAAIFAALFVVLAFVNPLSDATARGALQTSAGIGVLYGTTKLAISAISPVADADIGAGVVLSPGQVLTPAREQLNRFADMLFMFALVATFLSLILPQLAAVGSLIAALALVTIILLPQPRPGPGLTARLRRVLGALVTMGAVAAVIAPIAFWTAFAWGDRLTADAWNEATSAFDTFAASMVEDTGDLTAPAAGSEPPATPAPSETPVEAGPLDWVGNSLNQAFASTQAAITGVTASATKFVAGLADGTARIVGVIPNMLAAAEQLFKATVQLSVSYLIKLVVLPALVGALLLFVLRAWTRGPEPSNQFTPIAETSRREDNP